MSRPVQFNISLTPNLKFCLALARAFLAVKRGRSVVNIITLPPSSLPSLYSGCSQAPASEESIREKGASLPAINNWIRQAGHHASASDYGGVQMLALSQDAFIQRPWGNPTLHSSLMQVAHSLADLLQHPPDSPSHMPLLPNPLPLSSIVPLPNRLPY